MIRLSITYTRPNINIPWHTEPESGVMSEKELELIYEQFIATLKMVFANRVVSDNGLQLTHIGYWANNENILEYQSHPLLAAMNLRRNKYYQRINGTIGTILKIEVNKINSKDLT